MAWHKIQNNGSIETLNKAELEEVLGKHTLGRIQEQARGVTTARFDGQGTVSSGSVTIPASGSPNKLGPKMGFAWTVQRITAFGLTGSDTLSVYRNAATAHNFLGTLNTGVALSFGSKGLVLRADENLVFTGASLSATGDIVVNGEGVEVPETDLYKLL